MHIIIDFDYTLFDTEHLRRKLIASLQSFGISEEQYRHAERQLKQKQMYTLEAHMQFLLCYPLQKVYEIVDDSRDCVYPDAIPFLKKIRSLTTIASDAAESKTPDCEEGFCVGGSEQQSNRMTLFSLGNPEWQRRKIDGSGLVHFFDDIVLVDTPKELHREKLNIASGSDTLYISDRGSEIDRMKQVFSGLTTVLIRRPGTPYEHEPSLHADHTIQSLNEVDYGLLRKKLY